MNLSGSSIVTGEFIRTFAHPLPSLRRSKWIEQDRFVLTYLSKCEIEGRPGEKRWVLSLSWRNDAEKRDEVSKPLPYLPQGEKYYVGNFDGKVFRPDKEDSRVMSAGDVYATVTWKGETDRKAGIGWMITGDMQA